MSKDYDELPVGTVAVNMSDGELSRIIDFVEQLEDETESNLGLRRSSRELRILINLMRNHIEGRLSTQSSLVAGSGLAYGTALRALQDLTDRGLIIRRPRTKSGKTYSLHPSSGLISSWKLYGRRVKSIVGSAFGWSRNRKIIDDYYFGASYMCAQVIPPPGVLTTALPIGSLRMLVHADPTFLAMSAFKRQLESMLGVQIKNKALSIDRLHREIVSNAALARSQYDIVACNLPWFGKLASEGILMPLGDVARGDLLDLSDFHPEVVASATWRGVQYGIPVQTAPELLFYRRDLFEEAGVAAPTSIELLLAAARKLHNPLKPLSGIAWNAARGTPVGHTFIMMMADFGQPAINLRAKADGFAGTAVRGEEHRPMFLTEAARMTAELLLELLHYSPPNVLNMSWYERAKCYAGGQSAMAYCYTLLASLFLNDKASPACQTSNFLPHPPAAGRRAIAPVGGYAFAIPANIEPERKQAVWTAIRALTSAESAKQFIIFGGTSSPRFSVGGDPEVEEVCPLISAVDEMARGGLLQTWPRAPVPEMPQIIAIVGDEIHKMLRGERSIVEALSASQNRADGLMRQNGHY